MHPAPSALALALPLGLAAAAALAAPAAGQAAPELAFPMDVVARTSAADGAPSVELAPRAGVLEALASQGRLVLTGVPRPEGVALGGRRLDLAVERVALHAAGVEVRVDGAPRAEGLELEDLTLWRGTVVGAETSDVWLALSAWGSRGWIRADGETLHLCAEPGPDGDWARSRCRLVSEAALAGAGCGPGELCAGDALQDGPHGPRGASPAPAERGGGTALLGGGTQLLRCDMAVETDWHFYSLFGSLPAAETYATSLFAAMGDRFETQCTVRMNLVYLGLWTTPADPWTSPETPGADTGTLLGEFRQAWRFNMPNGAVISHILTGAPIGGGVAWVDVICNPDYGFAASASLHGQMPFPVAQGPLMWDFFVFAHETGHNMGSPHTHDFCPPLDECAPPEYFGSCQTQQVCVQGTIMSYCHLCGSGQANVAPVYHSVVADVMRQAAEASCLPVECSPEAEVYCANVPNSTGTAASIGFDGTTSVSADDLVLFAAPVPVGNQGLFYYGPEQVSTPLGDGIRCVGNGAIGVQRLEPVTADVLGGLTYSVDLAAPWIPIAHRVFPGERWFFQGWFRDPQAGGSGFGFSAALGLTFCP